MLDQNFVFLNEKLFLGNKGNSEPNYLVVEMSVTVNYSPIQAGLCSPVRSYSTYLSNYLSTYSVVYVFVQHIHEN